MYNRYPGKRDFLFWCFTVLVGEARDTVPKTEGQKRAAPVETSSLAPKPKFSCKKKNFTKLYFISKIGMEKHFLLSNLQCGLMLFILESSLLVTYHPITHFLERVTERLLSLVQYRQLLSPHLHLLLSRPENLLASGAIA